LARQPTETTAGERALRFALAGLAVWRVTHLLAAEDGPADVIVKLRVRAGSSPVGGLMDCFDCLSLWVATGFVPLVARRPGEGPVTWLALSGAACVLQRIAGSGDLHDLDLITDMGGP